MLLKNVVGLSILLTERIDADAVVFQKLLNFHGIVSSSADQRIKNEYCAAVFWRAREFATLKRSQNGQTGVFREL